MESDQIIWLVLGIFTGRLISNRVKVLWNSRKLKGTIYYAPLTTLCKILGGDPGKTWVIALESEKLLMVEGDVMLFETLDLAKEYLPSDVVFAYSLVDDYCSNSVDDEHYGSAKLVKKKLTARCDYYLKRS